MDDEMYDDEDHDLIGQVSDEDDLDDDEDDDDEHMMEQDPHDYGANGRSHHQHQQTGNGQANGNGGDRRDQPAPQQQPPPPQAAANKPAQVTQASRTGRRNRLSDQVDDEPPLRGYKRYVARRSLLLFEDKMRSLRDGCRPRGHRFHRSTAAILRSGSPQVPRVLQTLTPLGGPPDSRSRTFYIEPK